MKKGENMKKFFVYYVESVFFTWDMLRKKK